MLFKWKWLLAASIATAILQTTHGGVFAATSDEFSNRTLIVNSDSYILDGTTYPIFFPLDSTPYFGELSYSGNMSGNTITFNTGARSQSLYSGYSDNGNVFNNKLYLNSGDFQLTQIYGGYTYNGNANDNVVSIASGVNLRDYIGSNLTVITGGHTDSGNANNNTVDFQSGTIQAINGGVTYSGDAKNNTVNISGGTIGGTFSGYGTGMITGGTGTGEVSGNTVNINGGTINVAVTGGAGSANSPNNFINIWGNPNLSNSNLFGGNVPFQTGNTLNLATSITVQNVANFDAMNFFIPKSMTNGGTMLTLTSTDGTNLSGTAIRAAMQGGSTLDTGDTVTLIQSAGTITTDSSTTYGKMTQAEYDAIKNRLPSGMLSDGVSLDYDMTVEKSGDNAIIARIGNATTDDTTTPTDSTTDTTTAGTTTPTDSATNTTTDTTTTDSTTDTTTPTDSATDTTTNSTATVPATIINGNGRGNRSSGKLLPQTQLIANSAVYSSLQLVDFMSDKLVDWLPPSSFDFEDEAEDDVNLPDVPQKEPKGYEIFITGSGGSFRTKTGSGSYIESTLKGFDVGFGRSIDYSNGRLVFAPIFEYATGDYDSYLDGGMHGKGSTKYFAGGLIGRKSFKSGFYIEASARGGKTERDFSSDTMTSGGSPVFVHYSKTSAPIFAGHLRVGRQLRLNKNNLLDVYGIYFHTHQGSMNVNLSTGEDYHFSSANAGKVRLGYRLTTRTSRISRIYTGLAFQYEHNSDAIGMYKGRRTPGTGNHGASGMLELGWMIRPNKDNPWMLDLNATGFVGHQRGLSGTLKLQKEF